MKTLDELGIFFQTDKASQFSRTYAQPHDYLRHLERFFEPLRDKPIKLLEVGCGGGESMRTWLEYFPNAKVFGIDLVSGTNDWNTPNSGIHERYTFIHGDQSNSVFWKSFIKQWGGDWDIVIDDGAHISGHILTTFQYLWPHVKSGGIYEVEDLDSAVQAGDWFHDNAELIGQPDCFIDSIHFSRELVILIKK